MADFSNKVIYQIYPKSFKDSNGDESEILEVLQKNWII